MPSLSLRGLSLSVSVCLFVWRLLRCFLFTFFFLSSSFPSLPIFLLFPFLSFPFLSSLSYSCVRKQGFVNSSSSSYQAEERAIIDWQVQRYRVLKQTGLAYAMKV
jgi:hypothetical protein